MEYKNFEGGQVQEYVQSKEAPILAGSTGVSRGALPVAVSGISGVCAFLLMCIAANEWGFHDINGECSLVNSGTEWLNQPVLINTCGNGKASSFKECVKLVCKLASQPYYGQCYAPPLSIAGGVLGVVAAGVSLFLNQTKFRFMITAFVSLIALCVFSLCTGGFITSFFRFGSGNYDNRQEISVNFGTPSCQYTYGDTRSSYKAMSAFGFLTAISSVVLGVVTCLWSHQQALYQQQTGKNLENTLDGVTQEFI